VTVVVLWLALASSPPAAAGASADDGGDLRARTHFAAGEYQEALEIYARLYAETMHPTYLRNIARCHQNLGNPDKAISSFREYLRKAKDLSADQRAEIEGYIAEMEQLKKSRAAPPSATPSPSTAPPPAAPAPETSSALVGPPTVTASGARDDDRGAFYTRFWFWGVVAGVMAAGAVTAFLLTRDGGPAAGSLGALDLRDRGR
jgi:tetratricopeptide (TPR) repeat protein